MIRKHDERGPGCRGDYVAQAIADLRNLDCVVVAQPNYLYSLIDDEKSCEEAADANEYKVLPAFGWQGVGGAFRAYPA